MTAARDPGFSEFVLAGSMEAAEAHRQLFGFPADSYRVDEDLAGAMGRDGPANVRRLHIVGDWQSVLRVLFRTQGDPGADLTVSLVASVTADTGPFEPSAADSPAAVFSAIVDAGRYDILRKICGVAKEETESRLGRRGFVVCHMVSEDQVRILASSL